MARHSELVHPLEDYLHRLLNPMPNQQFLPQLSWALTILIPLRYMGMEMPSAD